MFIHNFKYAFKTLFRNKALIFWTFAFPIILGAFFKMAFSNIESSEKLDIINIAIVENEDLKGNEIFPQVFDNLSDEENEDRLFNTKYATEEEAKLMLEKDDIIGYLVFEEKTPKIIVNTSGINETIFKYVTEEVSQTENIMQNVVEHKMLTENLNIQKNPDEIYARIYKDVQEIIEENANIKNISSNNLSYTMIEYYSLIAMTCLYGAILGVVAINQSLPNMSNNGKRVAVSPTNKGKVIFSSLLASYLTQIIGVALLFVFTIFVLQVDYGTNLLLVIILALAGSLAGLSLGLSVGTLIKTNENAKTGIIIAISMLGCFLSGMMGITMKYVIDKNVPILNKINPASMITDGLYSLYYYDTLDRYIFNVISLLIFSAVLIIASYISLRRQKYDSI